MNAFNKLHTLLYIIGIILYTPLSAQIEVAWSPEPIQELDIVNEADGVVTRKYTATNTGTYSWKILRGYTSCGCTQVKAQQDEVVRPGDSTLVVVSFNPAGKSGDFNEVVTVQLTDGEETKNETLTLRGEVRRSLESLQRQFPIVMSPSLRLNTAKVDFGELKRGLRSERHIAVCNTSEEPQTLQLMFSSPNLSVNGGIEAITILPYETLDLLISWDGKTETRWGNTTEVLTVSCMESRETATIELIVMLLPAASTDYSKSPSLQTDRRIELETATAGKIIHKQLTVQNTGNTVLQIYRIYSDCPDIKVISKHPIHIEPTKQAIIDIEIQTGNAKDFPITFISNDAKRPRQTVRMYQK